MSGASCTHYFWGGTSEGGWGLSCLSCDILYNWYRLMCYWKKWIKPSQKMFNGFHYKHHYKHYEPSTLNNKKVVCFGHIPFGFIGWKMMYYNQIRWSILCALHLTHPKCTHTRQWKHTWSSGQPFMLRHPASSWGFGALLKGTSSWYWGWRERSTFTPSTYNSCRTENQTRNLSITSPTL